MSPFLYLSLDGETKPKRWWKGQMRRNNCKLWWRISFMFIGNIWPTNISRASMVWLNSSWGTVKRRDIKKDKPTSDTTYNGKFVNNKRTPNNDSTTPTQNQCDPCHWRMLSSSATTTKKLHSLKHHLCPIYLQVEKGQSHSTIISMPTSLKSLPWLWS